MKGQAKTKAQLEEELGEAHQKLAELEASEAEWKRTEETLREAHDHLENLLNYANAPIIVWNQDLKIVRFNRAFGRLTGKTAIEAIGQPLDFLFPEGKREEALGYVRRTTSGERWEGVEIPIVAGDGGVRAVLWNSATLCAADGTTVVAVIAQGQDITQRKRAEEALKESEARYRELYDEAPVGYHEIDREGNLLRVNRAEADLLGYTVEEMTGRSILDFVSSDQCEFAKRSIREKIEGQRSLGAFERRYVRKDGTEIDVQIHDRLILGQEGQVVSIRSAVQDITERKRAAEALAQEQALLATRVEERTAELSAANAELARADRLKDEFLANMSHELRTPLSAILGLSESLGEGVYGEINEKQRGSLLSIERSGRHLLTLINDILDVAKVGAGMLELDMGPVLVEPLCRASLGLIKQLANKKRLKVTCNLDSAVTALRADSRRLKQVLVNLLTNAVKFTPEGGEIGLDVVGDAGGQVCDFTVWDTGIGVSAEDMPRLFKPFVQLGGGLKGDRRGTGLGLALVLRLVDLHGGGVTLKSEVGRGSRFMVSLPWKEGTEGLGPTAEEEPAEPEQVHVGRALVIEDTAVTAEQIVRYLQKAGAESVVHPQADGAVEMALEVRPDVVILDIMLPDLPGWDVLEQLRKDARTEAIPVIIVSAVDTRSRGLAAGAAACVVKPISILRFMRALTQALSKEKESPDALVAGAGGTEQTQAGRPLILLAEDNEDNVLTISGYLLAKGYRVAVARNGGEALDRTREDRPDLILMDMQMPVLDGLEATRRIRSEAGMPDVPIIVLTALAMIGDRERCLKTGANGYLSKPVRLKALVQAIKVQLCRTRALRPEEAGDGERDLCGSEDALVNGAAEIN